MQPVESVRAAFTDPEEFWTSPLYRHLCTVVASEPFLIGVAAHTRDGQVSTFAFFAAVHALLFGGVDDPLAAYYPSVQPGEVLPLTDAGPALLAFVRRYEAELIDIVSTRLVQTNHVQRAVGLRLALAAIAPSVGGSTAHLLEVGCSAGLLLRHAQYGYHLGGQHFGRASSPVQLVTEWRSAEPVPDLDTIPVLASTCGVDLHPLDPASSADRQWLEALVWPEDRGKAALLHDALQLAAGVPATVLAGDATVVCAQWSAGLPSGEPRIVFHCATRMHVPVERRASFDQAIAEVGEDGPLYHISIEGDGVQITEPGQAAVRRFDGDGHLAWIAPTTPCH